MHFERRNAFQIALNYIFARKPEKILGFTNNEACIGVLGIQDICHFTSRDIGYYPFYFQGYGILCSIFWSLRDIEYLGKLIMGIFANL